MVAGFKLAVALRAKGGNNLLIQTQGISGRAVQDSTNEVAATLARFEASGDKALDGSGDNPPGYAVGRMETVQGRYSVTYRLVNSVHAMVVSEPGTNVFLCSHLLDAVAKVLVGVVRGVDVTPERLLKRYSEVYRLLDDLLAGGLAALPPTFIHNSATDERLLALPTSAADAARRIRKMLGPGGKAASVAGKLATEGGDAAPAPPDTPSREQEEGGARFGGAAPEAGPLADVCFDIPPDALPPPPSRAAVQRRQQLPAVVALRPTPPPPAFVGALPEEPPEPAVPSAEAAAAAEAPAEQEGWAAFGAPEEVPAPAEPAFQAPVVTVKDVVASLQLVEVWRGEAAGGRLLRAGTEGTVQRKLAPYGLQDARFRVLPAASDAVNACMRAASMQGEYTRRDAPTPSEVGFTARFTGAPMGCAYLKYMLPAIACAPPLTAQLFAVPGAGGGGAGAQLMLALRYAASPALPGGGLLDCVVDLDLPPEVGALSKVSPAGQWCPELCRLRWQVGRVSPGGDGLLRAVFTPKPASGEVLLGALQQAAVARMSFSGWPGKSLSGLGFEVGLVGEEGAAARGYLPANKQLFGELSIRL